MEVFLFLGLHKGAYEDWLTSLVCCRRAQVDENSDGITCNLDEILCERNKKGLLLKVDVDWIKSMYMCNAAFTTNVLCIQY